MNKTFFLAEEMYADGDYKNALDLFRSIENKDDDVLNYIGSCYIQLKEFNLAESIFVKQKEANPNNARPYYKLGQLYILKGDLETAESYLQSALSIDPKCSEIYFYYGVLYEHKQNLPEAINQYEKALEINPDDPDVNHNLSSCYFRLGKYDKALNAAYTAYNEDPYDKDIMFNLGLILIRMKKYEQVVSLFNNNEIAESDSDLKNQLNYALEKLDKKRINALNYIIENFLYDTITDLDMVLTDSKSDPQYSAVTVYKRLETYLQYSKNNNQNVLDFIKNSGYDKNDIKIFIEKYNAEIPAYREYTDPEIKPI